MEPISSYHPTVAKFIVSTLAVVVRSIYIHNLIFTEILVQNIIFGLGSQI